MVSRLHSPTTQHAPLEHLLTWMRTRKIHRYVAGKNVLDFGSGQHLKTLKSIKDIAKERYAVDHCFRSPFKTECGINVFGDFNSLSKVLTERKTPIDCVTALACFEHIERQQLPSVLESFTQVVHSRSKILGTVPTPASKPLLEFLSYKLRLIDESQILDHKFYYNKTTLAQTCLKGGWKLTHYEKFQLGLNSFFVLEPAV